MKNKTYILNTLLAAVLGVTLLIAVLVRTFAPAVIIPALDVPNLVLVSLVALLLDYYLSPGAKRCYVCVALLSAVTFGLLPWAAAFVAPAEALKLAVLGGVVFTATTWLFGTMADRLSTGPDVKAAPVISALGLYLAAQILMGML
jgi:hypothetical protein